MVITDDARDPPCAAIVLPDVYEPADSFALRPIEIAEAMGADLYCTVVLDGIHLERALNKLATPLAADVLLCVGDDFGPGPGDPAQVVIELHVRREERRECCHAAFVERFEYSCIEVLDG